jgi:hypothetical protein
VNIIQPFNLLQPWIQFLPGQILVANIPKDFSDIPKTSIQHLSFVIFE